jgi:hypothetical protein
MRCSAGIQDLDGLIVTPAGRVVSKPHPLGEGKPPPTVGASMLYIGLPVGKIARAFAEQRGGADRGLQVVSADEIAAEFGEWRAATRLISS